MRAGGCQWRARYGQVAGRSAQSLPVITEKNWALWGSMMTLSCAKGRSGYEGPEHRICWPRTAAEILSAPIRTRASLNEALTSNPENIGALQALASSYVAQGQNATSVDKVRAQSPFVPSHLSQLFLGNYWKRLKR
jgi:hypothetical protein